MDERLDALVQSIRAWDWRAAPPEPSRTPAEGPLSVSPPSGSEPQNFGIGRHPHDTSLEASLAHRQQSFVDPPHPVEPLIAPLGPEIEVGETFSTDVSCTTVEAPAPSRMFALLRRLSSHPWTKLVVLGLAAGVTVILIVGGIRLLATSSNSQGTTGTTTRSPSRISTQGSKALISTPELNRYEGYADVLRKANDTATAGFVDAGSTPTKARIASVVTSYGTALDSYDRALQSLQWPSSMQLDVDRDNAQLQMLTTFLGAFNLISSTGVSGWLPQLHNRATIVRVSRQPRP